jgi:prephenate dehydrogenase
MAETKLAVIGCGLIGGSMALALRRRRPEWRIACLDLADRLPALRESGVADEIGSLEDMAACLPECSVVILATPVPTILEMVERIGPHLKMGAIVTDVGSTKKQIMLEAQKLMPPGTHFVGGHPMAGSERSGVEAADPLLFSDRVYLLCPYPDTPMDVLLTLLDLVESLMARPITIDPEEHDRIMAMVSHLPQLLAVALMHAAQNADATHTMLAAIAGRGFLDMTRLAASDYSVWKGILETNRDAILEAITRFETSLSLMRDAVSGGNAALPWEQASRRRRQMGSENLSRLRKIDLRVMIDHYDRQLLGTLGRRMQAARKVGKLKVNQATPLHDPDRERRMLQPRIEWGKSWGLSQDFIGELFGVILRHSTRIQETES